MRAQICGRQEARKLRPLTPISPKHGPLVTRVEERDVWLLVIEEERLEHRQPSRDRLRYQTLQHNNRP